VAKDTKCPLCKDSDSIGHILGGCTHKEVKKVYIARHDQAMRLVMKEVHRGGMGSFYCTEDVGTAEALTELGANAKRLPDWLMTVETMEKCEFPPAHKNKLRPDCMIVEVPREGPPLKRQRDGSLIANTRINGRPRKVWIVELGYTSDTRYLDKLTEKKRQHTQLCDMLTAEGYDVILLPLILGDEGTLFKCLTHALKELQVQPARQKKLYSKLHLHSIHTLQNLVSQRRYLERTPNTTIPRGQIRGR